MQNITKKCTFLLTLLSCCCPSWIYASISTWEKTGQQDGVTTYRQEILGSPVVAFRGEGIISAPIEKVASVLLDTPRATEWVSDLAEAKVIAWKSKDSFIEYDHLKTPPLIMKDREFVSLVKMEINQKEKQIIFRYKSLQDSSVVPETSNIRGELLNSTFTLTSLKNGTQTKVAGEIHCDPKGSVPKWLVNWFQEQWPVNTLKNLRKQVSKADIKANPMITALLTEKKDKR